MSEGRNLLIIAPCLNEAENIPVLVQRIAAVAQGADYSIRLLLIDDGSTDETWDCIEAAKGQYPHLVSSLRHTENRGIVASWRSGLAATDAQLVCLIDSDLQNPPEAIPSLYTAYEENPGSLVQGVRTPAWREKNLRYTASRLLCVLLNVAFRDNARDNKSGFVLGERVAILNALNFKRSYHYPQSFLRIAVIRAGIPVKEVNTLFSPRIAGTSFIGAIGFVRASVLSFKDIASGLREFTRNTAPLAHFDLLAAGAFSVKPQSEAPRTPTGLSFYFRSMPLHGWLIRPEVERIYQSLNQTQWLDVIELQQLQEQKLSRLMRHAGLTVPYYRRVFKALDVLPTEVRTREDLLSLPLLSKATVRSNVHFDLFSEDARRRDLHKIATSGSTGEPSVTYADRYQLEVRFAATLRAMEWTGWQFGERQVRLWHQTIGMTTTQALREKIDARLMRRKFVPAFKMTREAIADLVRLIEAFKPSLVDGYAESFNLIAHVVSQHGPIGHSPKAIISSAQSLTAQTRSQIQDAFGCPIHDKYGAREFSGIAYQCGRSPDFHTMDESYIVEILRDGKPALPGEVGEVVITDLNNYSFPLIRYRIGDLAIASDNATPCQCGRGLRRIGQIEGRTQALVYCAAGKIMPSTFFSHFFKEYENEIRQFQVKQDQPERFTLLIVPGAYWTSDSWPRIERDLTRHIGPTAIDFELVDEVPLVRTGKRTAVISTLNIDFQEISEPIGLGPRADRG